MHNFSDLFTRMTSKKKKNTKPEDMEIICTAHYIYIIILCTYTCPFNFR